MKRPSLFDLAAVVAIYLVGCAGYYLNDYCFVAYLLLAALWLYKATRVRGARPAARPVAEVGRKAPARGNRLSRVPFQRAA